MKTDWDDAYANAAYIPDAEAFPPRWAALSAETRADAAKLERDVPHGAHPRACHDILHPDGPALGTLILVHGGYWKAFGKDDFTFLARGALARNWRVAMIGYPLAPEVTIAEITATIAEAVARIAGTQAGPLALAGHSAGGHLVTRMVCDGVLTDQITARITGVLSIAGLHDLRPLRNTSMRETLRLTEAVAISESPALLSPVAGVRIRCLVGSDERPEFLRQSALLANIWTGLGARTSLNQRPARHHFNIIDVLTDPSDRDLRWLLEP